MPCQDDASGSLRHSVIYDTIDKTSQQTKKQKGRSVRDKHCTANKLKIWHEEIQNKQPSKMKTQEHNFCCHDNHNIEENPGKCMLATS